MNRGIVAGNWKMHGSKQFVADYVAALDGIVQGLAPRFILFPPLGYLALLADRLADDGLAGIVEIGAQNLHAAPEGAFTGETSGEMIRDLGASWVIVGHSERREYAAESNQDVAEKVLAALRAGLKPMLCVGETESERDAGRAADVVVEQLGAVIDACSVADLATGAVAYEPVWAIGTGRTATPQLAQDMHALIRGVLADRGASELAETVPLLYGGSVKAANARELFAERDIDGGLVGGASLQADELVTIARQLG
jgi:triosephosphate isomerase